VLPRSELNVMSYQNHIAWCCHHPNLESCHPIATCHIAAGINPSAILKLLFRRIVILVFLIEFELQRSPAVVSSPIQLLNDASIYSQHGVLCHNMADMSCFTLPGTLSTLKNNCGMFMPLTLVIDFSVSKMYRTNADHRRTCNVHSLICCTHYFTEKYFISI